MRFCAGDPIDERGVEHVPEPMHSARRGGSEIDRAGLYADG